MLAWAAYLLVVSGIMSPVGSVSSERAALWLRNPLGMGVRAFRIARIAARSFTDGGSDPDRRNVDPLRCRESRCKVRGCRAAPWTAPLPIRFRGPKPVRLDAFVEAVWVLSSAVALAILLAGGWYGRRRRRSWRQVWIEARSCSCRKTRVLRPSDCSAHRLCCRNGSSPPTRKRSYWFSHTSGVTSQRARPASWALGLGLGVLTAWNPLTWWQVRRSRLAIEVDCDRRVLRGGYDAHRYARTLVDVSTHDQHSWRLAASSRSLVVYRAENYAHECTESSRLASIRLAGALLALGIATATHLVSPPAIPLVFAETASSAEQTDIGRYVGTTSFRP